MRRAAALLPSLLVSLIAPVALGQPGAPPPVVTARVVADGAPLVAGQPFRLAVVAEIAPGFHVNSHTPKEDYLIPTSAALAPVPGITLKPPVYPKHVERKFAFAEGLVAVYEGRVAVVFEGAVEAGAAPGARKLSATLDYQACNDQQCLAPAQATATLDVLVAAAGTASTRENADVFAAASSTPAEPAAPTGGAAATAGGADAPGLGNGALREKWAVKGVPTLIFLGADGKEQGARVLGFEPPASFLDYVKGGKAGPSADLFAGKSLPLILLLVFVSGLALNLTPCVYPLIPITLGFFSRQSAGKTSRTFGLALAYVLGMSVTYSALGVFAALSGSLFGGWLQKPAALVTVAAIVLALALSMFGLFEIQAPGFIRDKTGSKSGVLGAATMGLFVGFVAAPCIGPFVLSLLTYVAAKGSVLLGFGLFFTLAMGLGVPYLVLGTVSGSLKKLPRSGDWMVAVKKAFGFILVSLAIYFLRALLPERVYEIALALPLVAGGLYFLLIDKTAATIPWWKPVRVALAVAFVGGGVWLALPERSAHELAFQPYSDAAVEAAKRDGKPVMIDFYADWCLPCKELDKKTFTDPKVVEAMKGWVLLKADLTKG